MTATHDIVARLWNLCHVLRDDGITYHEYVTELTYLLFLKMAAETGTEDQIPEGWRWGDLAALDGLERLRFDRHPREEGYQWRDRAPHASIRQVPRKSGQRGAARAGGKSSIRCAHLRQGQRRGFERYFEHSV